MTDRTDPFIIQKYTEIRPCVVEGQPDAHTVWLKVDHQAFCITPQAYPLKESQWMADMLGKALERIVVGEALNILNDRTVVATHIMRNWDRETIESFATHLLGDKCQECWAAKERR